nr:uncharacterized protein LOC109771917 [Aegilops tauschii subsp. strangulata]
MVTMLPPPPAAAPLVPGPSASPDVLEHALSEMTRLREVLQGADSHLVAGRLELVSGWFHSDVSVQAALSQATATSEKDKQAAAQATAAREVTLKDVKAVQDRCQLMEAELKTLHNERAEEARGRKAEEEKMKAREDAIKDRDAELEQLAKAQAAEHSRLEKLEQKVEAVKAELDAKAKVLAEDRVSFELLEERSRVALQEVVISIGPMAEAEARVLSSAALTCVFSHLHLRDPTTDLDELLEPVDGERCIAAAEAVKG